MTIELLAEILFALIITYGTKKAKEIFRILIKNTKNIIL